MFVPDGVPAQTYVNTAAGAVPLQQWQQWQALADSAALNRSAPAGPASGAALHMQLKQWQQDQALLQARPQVAMRGGPAIGAASASPQPLSSDEMKPGWDPHADPSNSMLHSLLSEAVAKTFSTKPSLKLEASRSVRSTSSTSPCSPAMRCSSASTAHGAHAWTKAAASDAARRPRSSCDHGSYVQEEEDTSPQGDNYYPEDHGEYDQGSGDADGDADGAVEALFGQVLSLQEQLQKMDAENSRLKRQLQDQKGLMQQMQAALMDQEREAPSGGGSSGAGVQPLPEPEAAGIGPSDSFLPGHSKPAAVPQLPQVGSWDQGAAAATAAPVADAAADDAARRVSSSWLPEWPAQPQLPTPPPEIEMQRVSAAWNAAQLQQQQQLQQQLQQLQVQQQYFMSGAATKDVWYASMPQPAAKHEAPAAHLAPLTPAATNPYPVGPAPGDHALNSTSAALRYGAAPVAHGHYPPASVVRQFASYPSPPPAGYPPAYPQQHQYSSPLKSEARQLPLDPYSPHAAPLSAGASPQAAQGGPRSVAAASWACQVCTYEHAGKEALFLRCSVCGAQK